MKIIQEIAIIHNRGQLTIPGKVRDALMWPSSNSVVSLTTTSNNELLIKPYQASQKTDWDGIWKEISKARSIKGKSKNLSYFIAEDRKAH